MNPAIENLKTNQRQLDADGCEVGVSRQALDETLAEVSRLQLIEATARELIGPAGMRLTMSDGHLLAVIEKPDNSDPHARLCVLLDRK